MDLFTGNYKKLIKIIFSLYDFDKDGKVYREDIRIVFSYIPLNSNELLLHYKMKFEQENVNDRKESINEINKTLERIFDSDYIDETFFKYSIENINSDIFVFLLIFLYERRPFSNDTLNYYQKIYENATIREKTQHDILEQSMISQEGNLKLIMSPSPISKYKPATLISNKIINPYQRFKSYTKVTKFNNQMNGNNNNKNLFAIHPTRTFQRSNIKSIVNENVEIEEKGTYGDLLNENNNNILNKNTIHYSDDLDSNPINYEGYLYKITSDKNLKKMYFKLIFKDLFFFKNETDKIHSGLHNLNGVFIKEGMPLTHNGINLFAFSVVYPKKERKYYTDSEKNYKMWLRTIRKAIGYEDLYEAYNVKDKIGSGRFGFVRVGLHRGKNRDVAIKIMNKRDMTTNDLINARNQIEILKITQSPNILQLYDIIENEEYIYIIMEHCFGGDLLTYLEKRNFKLTESRAAEIIYKLSKAVEFLHSRNILHRDLKPENILMTNDSDFADIKLFDFCISKMIKPGETFNECVGTIGYMAPEVLLGKKYSTSADVWSIGVISYLLLSGYLPFDDESEKEIIRMTLYEPVEYPNDIWKKISHEANIFVDKLLMKEVDQRMKLSDIFKDPWIIKYGGYNNDTVF